MQDELTKAIATDLGINDLKPEEQQALISQFGEVALKAATIAIVEKMPEAKREEFTQLAEAGDALAVQTFLDAEVPGHEAIAKAAVAEEVKRFKAFQAP
ncbi:MAG: hypothetical protein JWN18_265 [Parcubacteria group bacterium]|nr:hypothetical protein [Parcubacteria group bacterium]